MQGTVRISTCSRGWPFFSVICISQTTCQLAIPRIGVVPPLNEFLGAGSHGLDALWTARQMCPERALLRATKAAVFRPLLLLPHALEGLGVSRNVLEGRALIDGIPLRPLRRNGSDPRLGPAVAAVSPLLVVTPVPSRPGTRPGTAA